MKILQVEAGFAPPFFPSLALYPAGGKGMPYG
jgi:hypothetical protein